MDAMNTNYDMNSYPYSQTHDLGDMEFSYEKYELKFVPIQAQARVGDRIYLSKVSMLEETSNEINRELIRRIKAYVLGFQHEPIKFSMAATGWDSIKERFFPKWWLKRWPVRYEAFDIDVNLLYPFIKPPCSDTPYVVLMKRLGK